VPANSSSNNKKKKEKKPGRKKPCKLCMDRIAAVDYKDQGRLRRFVTDRGKIAARRITGTCAKHQRQLALAIKRSRHLAMLPFVREHYR
jgi:small subunit ribosomal protein S18